MERKVLKWAELAQKELNCFKNLNWTVEYIENLDKLGMLHIEELKGDKGVVAYIFCPDMKGNTICSELFMYIKPEYRGDIKLFRELIDIMERAAKENNCKFVTIGSNIGYRDDKLLRLLSRYGYKPDTVKKEV